MHVSSKLYVSYIELTIKSLSGSCRTFIEPSAPQLKSLLCESTKTCETPWLMFLKMPCRECSSLNV